MSRDLGVKSIDVYMDGLSCYAADIGFEDVVYEYYFIRTSDGLILFKNNNGEYAFGGQEITDDCQHNNQLPMLTRDDVTLNSNNTITISDNYMKRLYTAWVESDVESSWTAGYYSIDYALIVDLIKNNESANFNTTLSFADDGTINAYSIMLSDGENIYYTFDFENSDIKTTVKLSMNTSWTINSEFVYVKGESGYATFDVEVGREVWQSSYDYQVRVDVLTNIPDFEYDNELKEMIDQAKRSLTLQDAAAEKYAGEFTCEDSCAIMCYDAELDAYMLFSTNEGEAYQFMGATTLLPNFYLEYACFGSVDMNTRTLTVTKHSNDETVTPALLEKYAGTYTINQTTETDSVIVFDVDTERYVIFEYVDEEHVVCSGVVFCGEEKLYEGVYPVAIADITNKTVTVQ